MSAFEVDAKATTAKTINAENMMKREIGVRKLDDKESPKDTRFGTVHPSVRVQWCQWNIRIGMFVQGLWPNLLYAY